MYTVPSKGSSSSRALYRSPNRDRGMKGARPKLSGARPASRWHMVVLAATAMVWTSAKGTPAFWQSASTIRDS